MSSRRCSKGKKSVEIQVPAESNNKGKRPSSGFRRTPETVVESFDEDEEDSQLNYETRSDDEDQSTTQALRTVIHKQAEMIQKLDREIIHLRNGHNCSCQKHSEEQEDLLSYINCKIDVLTEQVLFIAKKVANDRRCRGYCVKHVRTRKCLCRGLEAAHRCCGRIGSICDC